MIPVVIPAYEPGWEMIEYVEQLIKGGADHILIIDDGSGEEYEEIFERLKFYEQCSLLRHAVNLGKGRALKDAFNHLLVRFPTIKGCVTADSDGQHRVEDILKCCDSFSEHEDEMIIGSRDFDLDNVPAKSKFGNKLTRMICKYLIGLDIKDTQTGLRVIPRKLMEICLTLPGDRFEFETNMLIACKDNGFEIIEVPIETVYDSKTDHVTHFDPVADSIKIYKIFAVRFLKYIVASLSASALDLALFTILCALLRKADSLDYVVVSSVTARVFSAVYNYFVNYAFVFESRENRWKAAFKYAVLAIVQMFVSTVSVVGLLKIFRINETVVKAVVDTILFFVNYAIQRKYVYKK